MYIQIYISIYIYICQFNSVAQIRSDSLRPHGPQHTRLPRPSPTPRVYSNSCPSSQWHHPTISSSVIPFSSCHQSFPVSGSFPVSWLFISGDQSIGATASASVLPMNIQDWFPLGLTGLISLCVCIYKYTHTHIYMYIWICLQCRRRGFNLWVRSNPLEKGMATHSSILA